MVKGYKITNPDGTCRGFKYEVGKVYKHDGDIELCEAGFHFCRKANHCFNYYGFDSENKVFEVEATGKVIHGDDKSVTDEIKIVRELDWQEVLVVSNAGHSNTGHSNSGDRNSGHSNSGNWNSGDRNSGYWNSGDRNSGYRNSGYRNSGYRNSGNWNSGDRNSGNWNSGDRNSGDSNSGYRNSGAFCTDGDPILYLFNKRTEMTVREWEDHMAVQLMDRIDPTIWVPGSQMTDEEKEAYPGWETTEGYLKTISMKEAWANMWHNLTDDGKEVFTSLPNFDAGIFEEITGIKVEE